MADPWEQAWAEAVASVPKDDVMLETVELHHSAFLDEHGMRTAIRAVNQLTDKTLRLDLGAPLNAGQLVLYRAIPFLFGFPAFEEGRAPECTLRVDNIGREISPYLNSVEMMNEEIVCIYRVYMASDPNTVAFGPFRFTIREVVESGAAIEGRATIASVQNLKFLRRAFASKDYPALLAVS